MSPHGLITEPSVSAHPVTHDRKGREGKGDRKGTLFQDQSCYLTVGALCSCHADAHPAVSYAFLGLEPIA